MTLAEAALGRLFATCGTVMECTADMDELSHKEYAL